MCADKMSLSYGLCCSRYSFSDVSVSFNIPELVGYWSFLVMASKDFSLASIARTLGYKAHTLSMLLKVSPILLESPSTTLCSSYEAFV